VEDVCQDGHRTPTEFRRVGTSNRFDAVNASGTSLGAVSYDGGEWAWSRWSYDLRMPDGSVIKGEGSLAADALRTSKAFSDGDGRKTKFVLSEDLRSISAEQYALLEVSSCGGR